VRTDVGTHLCIKQVMGVIGLAASSLQGMLVDQSWSSILVLVLLLVTLGLLLVVWERRELKRRGRGYTMMVSHLPFGLVIIILLTKLVREMNKS
jgi:hypothetical protein